MNSNIVKTIRGYFQNLPVERAWIFGSFSRGEETADSDIDLLVEFTNGAKIGMLYFRIIAELERLCSRKIDLAEVNMLDNAVIDMVNNDRILIYERI